MAPCVAALLVTGTITSAQELPTAPLPVSFAANVVTDSPPPVAPDPALFRNLFIQPDQRTPLPEDPQWQESNEDAVPVGAGVLAFLPQLSEQDPQKPPTPPSTGIKAVFRETWRDFKAFPRRKSTWVILAVTGGAAAAAHPLDDDVNAKLGGSDAAANFFAPGKWIGAVYVQAGVAVGLYVIGRYVVPHAEDGTPKTNKVSHLGFDMLRALAVSQTLTQVIKVTVQRDRPTGECCAFPSGHASASFATAAVLERHFGYRAFPTFLVASYVAMSRLHDNRHYLSDVIFGAGLGVASGWTVVGRHGRSTYALTPVPIKGGLMLAFTRDPAGRASSN
ncbi:phosphatase PAP2 family protein [Luteitalea pratensis]|uniref:phosphatase PAP2 family protein n=1 Tax=Luteitalea pratensis TaxID=1855912 RepID=UPI0012FF6F5F|nr:phosphatase PAP2 family protein [Luteitalea pratensis]